MTTLSHCPVFPNDRVYDIVEGPGVVKAVDGCRIHVTFESTCRDRSYNENGVASRKNQRTLYWSPPIIIEFPKGETESSILRSAVMDIMRILNDAVDCLRCDDGGRHK